MGEIDGLGSALVCSRVWRTPKGVRRQYGVSSTYRAWLRYLYENGVSLATWHLGISPSYDDVRVRTRKSLELHEVTDPIEDMTQLSGLQW
ncbi:hypothetical protein DdX_06242 [Ditylenchus destructor]|uniref:Uncharacterized protein n=1 Tax=Ditylenchus destructor TaxID=166010 RepID=A0AAD4NCB8_9BILA|nr:hypothetical protein DdX_06242 [Ditylenchus destructor]